MPEGTALGDGSRPSLDEADAAAKRADQPAVVIWPTLRFFLSEVGVRSSSSNSSALREPSHSMHALLGNDTLLLPGYFQAVRMPDVGRRARQEIARGFEPDGRQRRPRCRYGLILPTILAVALAACRSGRSKPRQFLQCCGCLGHVCISLDSGPWSGEGPRRRGPSQAPQARSLQAPPGLEGRVLYRRFAPSSSHLCIRPKDTQDATRCLWSKDSRPGEILRQPGTGQQTYTTLGFLRQVDTRPCCPAKCAGNRTGTERRGRDR